MSIKVMSWVWDKSPYDGKVLLMHLALADYANDEGICWPSQASLSRKARCTIRYVREGIQRMKDDGYLEVVVESDGIHTNRYKLLGGNSVPVRNTEAVGEELDDTKGGNPLPKNRQEPSRTYKCPYCRSTKQKHYCSAMNMRMG